MSSRNVLYGIGGFVIGAASMYFLMSYIHEKELDEIFSDVEEIQSEGGEGGSDDELDEDYTDPRTNPSRPMFDAHEEDGVIYEAIITDEDAAEDEAIEEAEATSTVDDEDPPSIFIIKNEDVSNRQVVGVYNHDDGSVTVDPTLSVEVGKLFDEVIENDALFSLINEEAFDILMNSAESTGDSKPRLLCVRNNVINLDFIIRY